VLTWLILLVTVAGTAAYFRKDALPPPGEVLAALAQEPIQAAVNEPASVFPYAGTNYVVQPVADYEAWGLVVTHNDIGAFADIYHTRRSVDIRDICVIWGQNATSGDLARVDFWSEPWTCNFRTNDSGVFQRFRQDQVANNHMLAREPWVRDQILRADVGDQIHFRGTLVNYFPEGYPEVVRRSSTTRLDRGNGACEVVLVRSLEILRRGNPAWQDTFRCCKWLLVLLVVAKTVLVLRAPLRRGFAP
jgi:hypothetical protein